MIEAPVHMAFSPELSELAKALAKAQSEIQNAKEDATNPHFKSRYATLASIWNACRKPLTDNGLSIVQLCSSSGRVAGVTTVLLHSSGQWIRGTLHVTARDETPQSIGSSLTYCKRYGLAAMVGVAPGDDDDGESAHNRGVSETGGRGSGDSPPPADDDIPFQGPPAKITTPPPPVEKYDPKNERHQERLSAQLEKKQVPLKFWDDVGFALKGQEMTISAIDAVIKRIVK